MANVGKGPATRQDAARLAVALLLVAATVFDYASRSSVSALFGVPVLVAALALPPQEVLITAALAVGLDLLDTANDPWPLPLLDASTEVLIGALAVLVARQKQALARSADKLRLAGERQQRFVSMVSHELRNPITSMSLRLQLAGRPGRDARARLDVGALERSLSQVRRLVNDLHDASLIGSGHFAIQAQLVDLTDLLRLALAELVLDRPGPVCADLAPSVAAVCDPERIRQVLLNLVSNAAKYSPPEGEILVRLRAAGGVVELSVSDHGPGLGPAQRARLFQPFERAGAGGSVRGTGLGLYITRAIAEAHGGSVTVQSEPGRGSTFTVRWPARAPQPPIAPQPEARPELH